MALVYPLDGKALMSDNPFRHNDEQIEILASMYDILMEVRTEVKKTNGRVTALEDWMAHVLSAQELEKAARLAYQRGMDEAPLLTRKHLALLVGIVTAAGAVAGNAATIIRAFM